MFCIYACCRIKVILRILVMIEIVYSSHNKSFCTNFTMCSRSRNTCDADTLRILVMLEILYSVHYQV